MANKLSFFFCVLLVILAVDSFWSSKTQVMALRNLPLLEEVQVIKQVVLQEMSCYSTCYSHADCRRAKKCTQCRQAYPHYSRERKCFEPI
ncbi:hypothetical protein HAX54_023022 [Datura stramonium]|uniref:Uncharacterized protein n=1 Tax=Datura stramonium TaxID=4076 RepID=A0ABS8UX01_DATST|nr:hypothetical protein [Datura stramonium]